MTDAARIRVLQTIEDSTKTIRDASMLAALCGISDEQAIEVLGQLVDDELVTTITGTRVAGRVVIPTHYVLTPDGRRALRRGG